MEQSLGWTVFGQIPNSVGSVEGATLLEGTPIDAMNSPLLLVSIAIANETLPESGGLPLCLASVVLSNDDGPVLTAVGCPGN